VWKYFDKSDHNNICVCNVLNDSGKKCNAQLKIVEGSASSLMFHLRRHHGISQDETILHEPGYMWYYHSVYIFMYCMYAYISQCACEYSREAIFFFKKKKVTGEIK